MVSAESPALVVADAGGPAQAFNKLETRPSMSSGHMSDGSSSLTRRSRVRRKNSRRAEDSSSDIVSTSGEISSSQLFVQIPSTDSRPGSSPKSLSALETGVPPRPPRSPQRVQTAPAFGNKEDKPDQQRLPRQRTRSTEPSATRPVIDDIRGRETRSENGQHWKGQRSRGVSLPRHAFRNSSVSDSSEQPSPLTPNAFSGTPLVPIFATSRRFRHQPRDSGVTQQSTASSSIYPKSTSTEGSYPSPPSLPAQDMDDCHIITVDPVDDSHLDALHEMDADEVSYRLRLLMQNNYYLPPAHSKPFSELLSPDTPKKSLMKSSSPTFFDIFKVVKKKAAVSSDNKIASAPPAPILRTTSDSSTLSGLLRPQQTSAPVQRMRTAYSAPQVRQEPKGRVVVVRERVEDLASVAKQAEQELKVRETERQRNASDVSRSDRIQAQFVDPTDSVDLPLVPPSEFFGPQAALLRGMGIDSSLGAALLADQLPPSSPGSWSADSEDMAWRKAILHAAVDHSLNNSSMDTPTRSGTSSSPIRALDLHSPTLASASPSMLSPSVTSPAMSTPPLPSRSMDEAKPLVIPGHSEFTQKPIIGQSILKCIIDDGEGGQAPAHGEVKRHESLELLTSQQPGGDAEKSRGLLVANEPERASSPTVPTTPLQPPPRRSNPTSSGSSSDNAQDQGDQEDDSPLVADASHLQTDQDTTLRLSDVYESHVGLSGAFGKLTPPGSQHNSATLSAVKPGTAESSRITENLSTTSGSHYSDDDGEPGTFHTPQEHTLASTIVESRPSFGSLSVPRESCESSQPSPTTSAFRDAYDRSQYADSLVGHSDINTLGGNSRIGSRASNHSDPFSFVSPPPRVSSMHVYNSMSASHRSRDANQPSGLVTDVARDLGDTIGQEEPGTPTALHVPRLTVQDLLAQGSHSSPYTASPISFFDAVEMQSHHDDSESSDSDNGDDDHDEDDDDDDGDGDNVSSVHDDASVASSSVGGYKSDSAGRIAIDSRAGSTHSLVHDQRRALDALLQHRNASSPQLSSRTDLNERGTGLEYHAVDHWRGISNVPQSSSRTTFWNKKHGKWHDVFPNPPRVSESTADWLKHEEAKIALAKRPQTASSSVPGRDGHPHGGQQVQQDSSVRRLDGMLIEHMEREKEVLKRITTTLSKPSL
ncbi:hypothetical protein ACEPAH_8041 [Sanghuangporus vaninii]